MDNPPAVPSLHFLPTASIETLQTKAEIIRSIRDFFDSQNFFEVHTPVLSRDTVVDLHLDPMKLKTNWGEPETRYLQTSPEFLMKRLLSAGAKSIYQISHAFRSDECGPNHNPEFLMLEWYRVGDCYEQGIQFLGDFACHTLPVEEVEELTYSQAFQKYCEIDIQKESLPEVAALSQALGFQLETQNEQDNSSNPDSNPEQASLMFRQYCDFLWTSKVEPNLGQGVASIIYDWPVSESALAVVRNDTFPVAERYELYYNGLELANGYHELLDANVLKERNRKTNRLREKLGKISLPEDSRLIDAMEFGLPACCGVAVGIDRLIMAIMGKKNIQEVISFPWNNA